MINPQSLRLRIRAYYKGHLVQQANLPSIKACEAAMHVVARATGLSVDELSRKIERSDVNFKPALHDPRQLVLFEEPPILPPLNLNMRP